MPDRPSISVGVRCGEGGAAGSYSIGHEQRVRTADAVTLHLPDGEAMIPRIAPDGAGYRAVWFCFDGASGYEDERRLKRGGSHP